MFKMSFFFWHTLYKKKYTPVWPLHNAIDYCLNYMIYYYSYRILTTCNSIKIVLSKMFINFSAHLTIVLIL